MPVPTLPSSISLNDIQNEFGGSNPIGIDEYYSGGSYVPAGTANATGVVIPSSGTINFAHFSGARKFALGFEGTKDFRAADRSTSGQGERNATITWATDGTCTRNGTDPTYAPNTGPLGPPPSYWGTPTTAGIGPSYELRIYVSYIFIDDGNSLGAFLRLDGTDITTTGYTGWKTIDGSGVVLEGFAPDGTSAYMEGTVYIRNKTSLYEVSRALAYFEAAANV